MQKVHSFTVDVRPLFRGFSPIFITFIMNHFIFSDNLSANFSKQLTFDFGNVFFSGFEITASYHCGGETFQNIFSLLAHSVNLLLF